MLAYKLAIASQHLDILIYILYIKGVKRKIDIVLKALEVNAEVIKKGGINIVAALGGLEIGVILYSTCIILHVTGILTNITCISLVCKINQKSCHVWIYN
jgi:hypothetical protein